MMKKKKQSRSQSSTREPSPDSSPSPRLLSIFRSKLVSGKDLKHMFRGMKTKTAPGLSSQSRIVRCPKCHKLLQEPIDATIYKCSGCNSILQAKRWELESNSDSIPEALLYSQNRSLSTQLESAEGGSQTPMSSYRKYNSRASPSVDRGYHSETVYKRETSDISKEWMRRADEFSVTGDSDAFASARSSPYNSRSNAASEWTQHERRYQEPPQVPFYPASPSPSSAYEYGYTSPFHGSQASASEQSYYHHQPNQFKPKDREGWFQESPAASPIRFPGETSDKKYYPSSSQSQVHDPRYHNLYGPSSSATSHRSVYSERSYQADTTLLRSQYSEHPKSGTSKEKSSQRGKKKHVRKKNTVVKRYVLPSAGGAPFATCSYCLELLQLPQVSRHGKHKKYQVRCGSCSGVLKFSVREKADTVLGSPGFAEETVTNHQDSASEGHEKINPDDSDSDNGSRDRSCKSNDAVIMRPNMETFEDDASKEDTRSISNTVSDSKMEALQPSMNYKLREQQPASSEDIGVSRNHLEQAKETGRVSGDIEEARLNEKNENLNPEDMFGESLEAETVSDSPVSHSGQPNEDVYETRVLSEKNRDTQVLDWEETQEHESECKWENIMGDKPGLILEKSRYNGDSICDISSSNGEIYEDTAIKEDIKHIAAAPQNENQRFIEHPDQSGEATVTTSRIHEEQSKYEYENLSKRQELDKNISDRVRYESEECRDETNEALDTGKVSEDGSVVSLTKASETFKTSIEGETGEERSASHQMDPPNENGEDSYEEILDYAGERTWAETMEDRAVLHLEEYETNYENYSKPFVGTINEPEEDADGRLESSSRGSFSDHESLEESVLLQESQDAKPDQSQHEYEIPSKKEELSNTVFDTERHEVQEDRYETNETLEPANMVGNGSFVSLEKASETNIGETGEERLVSHQMAPRNENLEAMGDEAEFQLEEYHSNPQEWTSERAPTFRLHEYEVGTMLASEEDANGRSSSSTDSTNENETSEEKAVVHEEPLRVDENKIEGLTVTLMVEDGPSLHLEKCGNDSTFEWTERAPTVHLDELGTMLEPDEHADGRSESRSTGSFNNDESSELRAVLHEEEEQLISDSRTEKIQLHEMTEDRVSLGLEKGENGSIKLEETFDWTSERALTFRLHESEQGTRLEPIEHADGRSETSSRVSSNEDVISKEREINHEEEPRLVTDSRTKAQQVDEMTEDMVSLDLEGENETRKLNETFKWTSERALTFRHREYELGTMHELDEDADGRSESSLRGSFNDHGISIERAVLHEDESWLVDDYETKALKAGVMADNEPSLNLEKCENEKVVLDQTLEPRGDIFRLSLDDTQTFKQGDTEENIPASEGHESPSKMAEEDILGDHLKHLQIENEKSGLISEPYSHFYNTTDPSEIVGLRLALYETQTSPLRSPLSSPMHTPMGSPLHILMRSPIASPMHSHIVSPMRSPINSSGSLSDVLFFGKKA